MADDRIKKYWSKEMEALLDIYQQFQTLLPSEKKCRGTPCRRRRTLCGTSDTGIFKKISSQGFRGINRLYSEAGSGMRRRGQGKGKG